MSSDPSAKNIATRSVRAGLESDSLHGAVVPPIYLSSNFAFQRFREPDAITAALNWYRALDLEARIGKISVPTLFIWGTADQALGRVAAEGTQAYADGPYRFYPLTNLSHWLLEEAPQLVWDPLLEHLNRWRLPRGR